jgi:sterol desaturase/sphingolipid hydroxylase (fatty acid hydroxylase superfamily)
MPDFLARASDAVVDLLPFACFFASLALATKGAAIWRDLRRGAPDIAVTTGFFVVDALAVAPAAAILASYPSQALGLNSLASPLWQDRAWWLVLPAVLVAGDYIGYWRHRLSHCRALWPIHAAHHSDRALNWFSLLRTHPLEHLYTALVDSALLALCGFPVWAIAANNLVRSAWGFFIHADLRWTLGRVGEVLVSPSTHRWHHARDEALAGKNFATLFTVWDRLHKTYQPSRGPCRVETGVENHEGGLVFELIQPFATWFEWFARRRSLPLDAVRR